MDRVRPGVGRTGYAPACVEDLDASRRTPFVVILYAVKLRLADDARVSVTVRSKGVLGAMAHALTFTATAGPIVLPEVDAGAPLDVPVEGSVQVSALEAPASASAFDRKQMLENLRGEKVLDGAAWPTLSFRGRYRGTLETGRLEGELGVRGAPRTLTWDVTIAKDGPKLRARGAWKGTLTDLGIKPFTAMLGALRLHDEATIELEAVFTSDV